MEITTEEKNTQQWQKLIDLLDSALQQVTFITLNHPKTPPKELRKIFRKSRWADHEVKIAQESFSFAPRDLRMQFYETLESLFADSMYEGFIGHLLPVGEEYSQVILHKSGVRILQNFSSIDEFTSSIVKAAAILM